MEFEEHVGKRRKMRCQMGRKTTVRGIANVAQVLQIMGRIDMRAFCPRSAEWVRSGGSWSIILAPFATHFGTFGTNVCISGARCGLNAPTNGFTSDFHVFCWPGRHPRAAPAAGGMTLWRCGNIAFGTLNLNILMCLLTFGVWGACGPRQ